MAPLHSSDLTPEVLTGLLRSSGALRRGTVVGVTLDMQSSDKGFVSDVATFRIAYSAAEPSDAPRHLFLKTTKPDLHPEYRQVGAQEVAFYGSILPPAHDLPVARCFYAEWDAASGHAALLLDDLSPTHVQRRLPLPPSLRDCERIVESLARIHAHWWNHPGLGTTIGTLLSEAEAEAGLERLEASFPSFLDFLGDILLPTQRAAYERILGSSFLRRRAQRLRTLETVTLSHGDAHTNNLMLPAGDTDGQAILIDWQRWSIDLPLYDLAFFMALHWTPERRAAWERPLVGRYYEQLARYGVSGYSWNDCWNDYRSCVIVMALIPIGQYRRHSPPGVVWYGMEQAVAAFNDLGCAELL